MPGPRNRVHAPSPIAAAGREQESRRREAPLREGGHPVAARPRIGGNVVVGVERRIAGRHVGRIVHRPVARSHAEQRMVQRHLQRVAVLDQPAAAAAFLVVGDAGQGVEVRRLRAPVEPVGKREGEDQARHTGRTQEDGPPANRAVVPQPPDPESLDREEHGAGSRAQPRGAGARQHQGRGRDRHARRAEPGIPAPASREGHQDQRRQADRHQVRHEVPIAERPARRPGRAREVGRHQAVSLDQSGHRAEHHRSGERGEQRRPVARPCDHPRRPEDPGPRQRDAARAAREPRVLGEERGKQGERQEPDDREIGHEQGQPVGGGEREQDRGQRGGQQHQLLRESVAVELEELVGESGEHHEDRAARERQQRRYGLGLRRHAPPQGRFGKPAGW